MTKIVMLGLLVLGGAQACGSSTDSGTSNPYPDDQNPDTPLSPGKADYATMPFATYRDDNAAPGQFSLFTITSDGIFHREIVGSCASPPCAPEVLDGLPITSKTGSTNYIRFEDFDGNLIDRYAWKYANEALQLRKVNTKKWQTLTQSADAWCAKSGDCDAQQIDGVCVGSFGCAQNHCQVSCDYTACTTAGGTCGDAASCQSGVIGDDKLYPCSGGSSCCLPPNAQVSFDPVSADNVAAAFSAARTEATTVMPNPTLSFVTVQGTPTKIGSGYADTEFQWGYVFVASGSDYSHTVVSVKAPGFTTSHSSGTPSGAYLPEDVFSASIKLGFAQIIADATAAGVTLSSCPFSAGGTDTGFVDVQGSFGPGGVKFFWELACKGASGLYRFDAVTGAALN